MVLPDERKSHRITPARRRAQPLLKHAEGILSLASPILLLLVWEALVHAGAINPRFFPAPSSVLKAFYLLLADGTLPVSIGVSLVRVCVGFMLGAVPAILVGIAMGLSPWVRAVLRPVVAALYPIPKTAVLPLIMLIFGLGEASKYAMVAIGVFFLVVVNTMVGVLSIPSVYLEVGTNLRISRWQAYRTIALPGALPHIASGCQLGFGLALVLLVVAEMLAAKSGIGYLIWTSWQMFAIDEMYVGLIVVALLGFLSQIGLDALMRRLVPWHGIGR